MLIKVRAFPDSHEDRIEKISDDTYHVYVRASAQNGHANKMVMYLISKECGAHAKLISGGTRHNKIVEV
jgi:uncharacterized protein YggU (UPF0235/DUF167 family)